MMKLVSIFMIIGCLVALADPCCGQEAACMEEITNAESEHHESPEPCDPAPCSAFFTCGNCPGFILDEGTPDGTLTNYVSEQMTPQAGVVAVHSGYVTGLKRPPKR